MRQTGLQDGPISASFGLKAWQRIVRRNQRQRQREERMRFNRRTLNAGLAASLAAPMISRVARAADTLKIGMVLPVTGPAAAVGGYALAGAKIALDRVNKSGGVLGKQLELVTEDDQTTNPGAVLAFSKLAAQPDIVAFLGPVRSTQNHAIANDILKAAKPFCFGGTDPALTKMGNPWMIRFRPNDSFLWRRDARQEELGARPFH